MKRIGLVGGMTPESTLSYYRMIIECGRQRFDNPLRNPVVMIYSIDLAEIAAHQRVGESGRVVEILVDVLECLRGAGAELGALTANTPHAFFDDISQRTELELISIVETTVARVVELGLKRVLLLGTETTMQAPMYPEACSGHDIEVVLPNEDERRFVNASIYEELALGRVTPELREQHVSMCRRHIDRAGIDGIVLACTEIPMVLEPGMLPVPLVDTARCHADAIFERAWDGPR